MIERQLSDHASTYLTNADRELEAAYDAATTAEARQADARVALAAAGRNRSWWRRLLGVETIDQRIAAELILYQKKIVDVAHEAMDKADLDRTRAAKGVSGERVLPDWFEPRLSNQWRLFNGYYNSRGEIDHLLLGPPGMWAVEVKAVRGKLWVYADDWELTRFDWWGNEIGRERAADKHGTGRSWGQQVAEPASVLARHLANAGHHLPVRTAVVLVDPEASITDVIKPGVDLVTADIEEFERAAISGPPILDTDQLSAVDAVIVDHHRQFRS